ncbi:unnamed protein product, partial [Vitis vinifera]
MDDKKTAAKLAISTRQVGSIRFMHTQVCAFILVYEQRMSHQPEVEDSPTIFVPLNTPALYRVDQLKGFFQSLESRAFQTTCCRLNCSTFRNMKSQLQEHVIGIPVSCQYDKPSLSNGSGAIIQKKWDSTNYRIKKKQEEGRQFCGWSPRACEIRA